VPQRLWQIELQCADTRATALVFATDEEAAADFARVETQRGWESGTFSVTSIEAVDQDEPRVLDLQVWNPDVAHEADPDGRIWSVPWSDGLFQRAEGASLVVAGDAATAERLVAEADPFEGQPPYGKPALYGPAQSFRPSNPVVVWINYDPDDPEVG
jgi:hypothetical protein